MAQDHLGGRRVEAVQQRRRTRWPPSCSPSAVEPRTSANMHRDVDLGAAGRHLVAAARADVRVLARGRPADAASRPRRRRRRTGSSRPCSAARRARGARRDARPTSSGGPRRGSSATRCCRRRWSRRRARGDRPMGPGGAARAPPAQARFGGAEGGGFEPPRRVSPPNGFQDRRIQPLCHPSAGNATRSTATRGRGRRVLEPYSLPDDASAEGTAAGAGSGSSAFARGRRGAAPRPSPRRAPRRRRRRGSRARGRR